MQSFPNSCRNLDQVLSLGIEVLQRISRVIKACPVTSLWHLVRGFPIPWTHGTKFVSNYSWRVLVYASCATRHKERCYDDNLLCVWHNKKIIFGMLLLLGSRLSYYACCLMDRNKVCSTSLQDLIKKKKKKVSVYIKCNIMAFFTYYFYWRGKYHSPGD